MMTQGAHYQAALVATNGLNDAQITVLTQATPPELVHQRKGRGGQIFDFLPHEEVTRILNNAFGHAWTTEVKQFGIIEGAETWVLLRLTIRTEHGDIYKEQFGQQDYLKNKQGEIVMSTGDCLKGAVSDALTKCASLLGIGLDLYGVTARERKNGNSNSSQANQSQATQPGNGRGDLNGLKREVKALIDQTRGLKVNGKNVFPSFMQSLNKANTPQLLETLKRDVMSVLSEAERASSVIEDELNPPDGN